MNVPLITWTCIAVAMIIIVLIRVFLSAHEHIKVKENHRLTTTQNAHTAYPHNKLFGIGSEREEFFIPGDRLPGTADYYGDDDD